MNEYDVRRAAAIEAIKTKVMYMMTLNDIAIKHNEPPPYIKDLKIAAEQLKELALVNDSNLPVFLSSISI